MAFLHDRVCSYDIFVLFLVSLISIVYTYRRSKCPPSSSSPLINWPFFGMTPYLLLNGNRLHDFATHILKFTNATFLFKGPWFANMDLLLTSDPANIHHILSKNFSNYPKGPEFRNIFDILGDGIFNSDDELWEIHRKTTMSIFKHPDFYTLLEETIKNKLDKGLLPLLHHFVSQGQEMDLQEIFQRFTFDSICLLLLDYDPESLSIHLPFIPCEKAFTDAEEALLWRHVWPEYFWKLQREFGWGKEKKMTEAGKAFDEFIYKCLSDDEKEKHEKGLLTSLMKGFQDQSGSSGDSRKFLKDTILNLMLAGRDTTSTGLSWFIYLIAKNPRVEDKIREEIDKELGGRKWNSSLLGAKELERMVYLHGGICEALRLYPPVGFEHKAPMEKDILPSGHQVDEHTKIILSFYSMGRMEWIWGDDCMEFKPERWFNNITSSSRKGNIINIKHEASYKFTAFHAGPRRCLGKEMGLIQMKMVAAAFIYHYHVELVEGHQVCPSDSIILQMKYGLKVKLFPITN